MLHRFELVLAMRDMTDNYACEHAGVGRDWIRKLRIYRERKVDSDKARRLALFLGIAPAYFVDPAVLDPMGEDLNEEWSRWAFRAAEHAIGNRKTEEVGQRADLANMIYTALVERARKGQPVSEINAFEVIDEKLAALRRLAGENQRAISGRKRRSRKRR